MNPDYVIQNWMRNRSTVAFIGLWESLHNSNFNCIEYEAIKNEAGANSFVLTPKRWTETTNAIGIMTKKRSSSTNITQLISIKKQVCFLIWSY